VLLSTPLHASSNFTVSVQLANKRGFKKNKVFYYYYSPEDGLHGPKHVVSEWKVIIKNFVAIGGHCNKVLEFCNSLCRNPRCDPCQVTTVMCVPPVAVFSYPARFVFACHSQFLCDMYVAPSSCLLFNYNCFVFVFSDFHV
jgi:hypothetical protein